MANVTANVSQISVNVTATPNVVNVSSHGKLISNVNISNTNVAVSSTELSVNVSPLAAVGNSTIRQALSVVDTGGDGSLTYSNVTGVFTYTGPDQDEANARIDAAPANVRAHFSATDPAEYNSTTGVISLNNTTLLSGQTTDNLTEGSSNEYFTTARARGSISNTAPILYDVSTGVISVDSDAIFSNTLANAWFTTQTTDDLAEGSTNLYYANSLVQNYLGGEGNLGRVESVTGLYTKGNILIGTSPTVTNSIKHVGTLGIRTTQDSDGLYSSFGVTTTILNNTTGPLGTYELKNVFLLDHGHVNFDIDPQVNTSGGQRNKTFEIEGSNAGVSYFKIEGDPNVGKDITFYDAYAFPRTDGTSGQVLTTDGSGQISWENPGISNAQAQAFIETNGLDGTGNITMTGTMNFGTNANQTHNFIGNVNVTGNIEVDGNLNYRNVTDLYVTDQKITLNANAETDASVFVVAYRPQAGSNAHLKWDESNDRWEVYDGTSTYIVPRTTSDLAEGTNLYFTNPRFDTRFDTRLAVKSTDDLSQGATNKYYSSTLFDADLATKTTDDLTQGSTNLYYSDSLVDTRLLSNQSAQFNSVDIFDLGIKDGPSGSRLYAFGANIASANNMLVFDGTQFKPQQANTSIVAEGTNLYYTDARFDTRFATKTTDDLTQGSTNLYYADSLVDTHLNTSTASAGELLSWTGSDYDWVAPTAGQYGNANVADFLENGFGSNSIVTTGNITADYFFANEFFEGDLNGAVTVDVYNNTAGTLSKGDAVYLTGGNQGDNPHVDLADADDASKMPALGIVRENIGASSVGQVVTSGVMNDSSHGYTLGADLFISTTAGALTETPPTGESGLLQKIGKVVSPNHIIVQGAFRTNATPNLNDGNIFVGNGSNQAVTADLSNFTYEISSSANISTSANVEGQYVIGETLVSDYPNTPGYGSAQALTTPSNGGFTTLNDNFETPVGNETGDTLLITASNFSNIGLSVGDQISFEDVQGAGNTNLNGQTFYAGRTLFDTLTTVWTSSDGTTTPARASVIGVTQPAPFDATGTGSGNVLFNYASSGSKTWHIEGDGGGQLLFQNEGVTNVTLATNGSITNTGSITTPSFAQADEVRVGSGEFVFGGVSGGIDAQILTLYKNENNPLITDPSVAIIGGGALFTVENDKTPSLNQENGLVLNQGSAQANSLYSVPRFAATKYGTGTDFANTSYGITTDGDWTSTFDTKAQRLRYYKRLSDNAIFASATIHSVGAIVTKTSTTSANVESNVTVTIGGTDYHTLAPISNGIIAFKTQQFDVANSDTVRNGTAFPYNESLDYPDSTAVFIDDTLNIGSDEGTYYRFPPTPGTENQFVTIDSANNIQFTNTIKLTQFSETYNDSGSISGAVSIDLQNGSIINANVTGDITSLGFTNITAGSSATLILTQGSPGGTLTTGAGWKFANGVNTLSTAGGATDIISVFYDGTTHYASLTTDYQ